jgi:uncharacterized protein (TIGR03083 family)
MTDVGSSTIAASTALDVVAASWQSLLATLDGIPEDRMTEPGPVGDWSVKDIFGHIAFWDRMAIEAVRRRAAGQADRQLDWETLNETEAAARRDRPLDALRDEMLRTHERLLDTVRSLLDQDPTKEATIIDSLRADTYEHYDEHAAEIRAWRERSRL